MFESFIKYFFIILSVFYLYNKILNIKSTTRHVTTSVCFSALISMMVYYSKSYVPNFNIPIMICLFLMVITYQYPLPLNIAFIASVISFGLSYFFFFIATLVIIPFAGLLIYSTWNEKICYIITLLILGMIQFFIATIPFRFKRLKNGMPFLLKKSSGNIGICISSIIVMLTAFLKIREKNDFIFSCFILLITICGVLLFMWWKKQLKKTYIEKLHSNEIVSLENEINKLKAENEKLSKIIHKDNKLIPSMEMAVRTMLISYSSKITDLEELKGIYALLDELSKLSNERAGTLSLYEQELTTLPSTGFIRLDSLLQYMQHKMSSCQITFNVTLNASIKYMIEHIIDEDSLSTLIADLLENAMIATLKQSLKNILLTIDLENNCYCINIFDSGIPFEADTFLYIGKEHYTTHQNTGGSGIGLMTTFELLTKYSASFIIDETINATTYTKKITICFDGLTQFRVKSNRDEVIAISSQRNDIILDLKG